MVGVECPLYAVRTDVGVLNEEDKDSEIPSSQSGGPQSLGYSHVQTRRGHRTTPGRDRTEPKRGAAIFAAWRGRVSIMPRARSLLSRLDTPVKIVAAIFALIVTVLGAGWSGKAVLDTTYAGAAQVQQKFDSLQLFLSKRDLRDLKRERGELERAKETRGLSEYEKGRLKEIKDEIEDLEKQLKETR